MDHEWAVDLLGEFVSKIERFYEIHDELQGWGDLPAGEELAADLRRESFELDKAILTMEPAVNIVMDAVDPVLTDYKKYDPDLPWDLSYSQRWLPARQAAQRAVGLHTLGAQASRRMRPDSPELVADRMHPWVWGAARSLRESGHYREAVAAVSKKVNTEAHNRADDRKRAETALFNVVFNSERDPQSGNPRFILKDDDEGLTGDSMRRGARAIAEGCYALLRNPISHQADFELTENEALEHLAAFSILARLVETSTTVRAESE